MSQSKSLLLFLLLGCFGFKSCSQIRDTENSETENLKLTISASQKVSGVSFVSPARPFDSSLIKLPNEKLGANWLCLMPFGFVREGETEVYYNTSQQWWGERSDGILAMANMAHANGYQIMLKPQIWKSHGSFTGHHTYPSVESWESFESNYEHFILDYAQLADSLSIPIFCIGTEWENFVMERPRFWFNLISKVRQVYHGKLTYAANWDEYQHVPFWEELDFLGVDAYFPLIADETPTVKDLRRSWQSTKSDLIACSDSIQKPILFTEYGYRSRNQTAAKPWESDRGGEINLQAQINAYEALFLEFWKEENFAGGFLWKWFPNYAEVGGAEHTGFTPQRKPVEQTIQKYYLQTSN